MVDLTKDKNENNEEPKHDHISMLTCYLRAAIDEFSEDHPCLSYGEIIGSLELFKLEVYSDMVDEKEDEEKE